ncbi:RimJ/RimL family protein N-acetyltransferase [Crossiella equi]|uniref:RimJ/RimL family protein N-acetyltransferase n=1 Tax=Crossiella equi TaxID=130796 RepID=A0ABS5AEA3_9PSEU|nr:GNAT family N-acetyltransferase [Crossiella equi]MBP2474928.1 RimJ/RimL family protein N-acetyltransferase [Crossiella equi]
MTPDPYAGPLRLSGHGVILREWTDADLPVMTELFDDPEVAAYTNVPAPFVAEEYLATIRRVRAEDNRLHLAVTTDGETPLGLGFFAPARREIGYIVGRAHRGRGLAARTTRLLTDWGHTVAGIAELKLCIVTENLPSQGVAKAAGYTLSPEEPKRLEADGRVLHLATWTHTA